MYKLLLSILFSLVISIFPSCLLAQHKDTPSTDLLLGKESPSEEKYNHLIPEVWQAYKEMEAAAKADGIALKIVSGYRSYAAQKRIWNKKYKRFIKEGLSPLEAIQKIITYSTLPGTSRHHWGTDIDLVDASPVVKGDVLLDSLFLKGPYQKIHKWMTIHSTSFGFHLVYTQDSLRPGFYYEPWHFSYSPKAFSFLHTYLQRNLIDQITKDTTLLGHQYIGEAFKKEYLEKNILGINPKLNPQREK